MTEPSGTAAQELAREQAHVSRAYARLRQMRDETARLERETLRSPGTGTPQALYERDVAVLAAASRRVDLEAALDGLVFGRLDRRDGSVHHVGRLGVRTEGQEPLVVDWRAPAAAAFYRATPADPEGIVRRRLISCRGEQVLGVEDDLLDPSAADQLPGGVVVGDGAFLAALSRERTGHMRDIVATIQREQDDAIRAPDDGALLVTGGPGTGKTAVALHRVAYLMYQHRDRYARRGVLVVGPSPVFVDYISQVLPSLGETSVQLSDLGGLVAWLSVTGYDEPALAAVKGSAAMAELARRAVRAAAGRPLRDVVLHYDGRRLRVRAGDLARRRAGLGRSRRSHNGSRAAAGNALRELLWRAYAAAVGAADWPEERRARERADFDDAVREEPAYVEALDVLWPILEPQEVFARLRRGELGTGRLAEGVLDAPAVRTLWDGWTEGTVSAGDVALADELEHLVGAPPPPPVNEDEEPLPPDYQELRTYGERLARRATPVSEREGHREFAHVVVDEAQDVTPMQWRMLGRRGRAATWTVVGDWAQSAWPQPAAAHAAMTEALGSGRRVRRHELTTNYRTSAEIAALAARVLRRIDPAATPPRAVRSTGVEPRVVTGVADLPAALREVLDDVSREVAGTVGVAAGFGMVQRVRAWLPDGDPRVTVVDPWQAKGLEFDACVVVAPEQLAAESATGLRSLYVALTRATQRLAVVSEAAHPLP